MARILEAMGPEAVDPDVTDPEAMGRGEAMGGRGDGPRRPPPGEPRGDQADNWPDGPGLEDRPGGRPPDGPPRRRPPESDRSGDGGQGESPRRPRRPRNLPRQAAPPTEPATREGEARAEPARQTEPLTD